MWFCYINGPEAVASDMAGPGWRIRLVQLQAKLHAQKGGGGPEDIRPVSRHPAMRSVEVEQDKSKTNANTNGACLF